MANSIDPYSPPGASTDLVSAFASELTPRRRWFHSAPILLGISFTVFVVSVLAAVALSSSPSSVVVFYVGCGVATLVGLWGAVAGLVGLGRRQSAFAGPSIALDCGAVLGNLFMTGVGMLGAFIATVGFARGRQVRRFGRVILPPLQSGASWARLGLYVERDAPRPSALANQWRENGRTEHASVAAFARLTLDLLALGAPPELVAAANADALDEIRHAELCFSLASSLDGKSVSPGPFLASQRARTLPRSRTFALATLAVDSLVDGALHEGVSARIIARVAKRCQIPTIRAVLKEIAADEGRHAADGWGVVVWCLEEGGSPVAIALRGAIRALPERMHSTLPEAAAEGSWECWGIHGRALEIEEYAAARRHVVARVLALAAKVEKAA